MARLFGAKNPLNPSNNLMRRRVGGFIEVDDPVTEVFGQRALQRGKPSWERGVMASTDIEAIVVFEEDRPFGGVEGWREGLGLDEEIFGRGVFVADLG